VITLTEGALPEPDRIADILEAFASTSYDPQAVDWSAFEAYSARESARRMAAALDEALARFRLRATSGATHPSCASPF
jgi:hypothetical protein